MCGLSFELHNRKRGNNCDIHHLTRRWKGPTLGAAPPKQQPAKKWEEVQTNNQYKSVEELEKEEAIKQMNTVMCMKCYQRGPKGHKFCKHCGTQYDKNGTTSYCR